MEDFESQSMYVQWSALIVVLTRPLSALPGLYTINKFYPSILFSVESPDTSFNEGDENKLLSKVSSSSSSGITFFNTSAVKEISSLCTCIALLDTLFRRNANVTWEEKWTEENITWKRHENIDQYGMQWRDKV